MTQTTDQARMFVCDAAEMEDNQIRQLLPCDAAPIAVYKVNGEFFATDDTCTHGQALLSEGEVGDDGTVECPWHSGTFCVRTGEATGFPAVIPIKVYPIHVEEGKVYVDLAAASQPQ
jgi:nitrite reductase/ring-hydroxylating ferredoxin subunit